MSSAQASPEASFTMSDFHRFASEHFAATTQAQRRRLQPAQPERLYWKAVVVFCAMFQSLIRRRKAAGLGAFLALRRSAGGEGGGGGGEIAILQELLKSQCETALKLEGRVQIAGRAGGLALCV